MGRAVTELSRHTFELDLTSVCVSSGTIQLPLKMQHFFTPGRVRAEVDGQTLPIGVMLTGRRGRDHVLLRLAAQLESAHPWPRVAPLA